MSNEQKPDKTLDLLDASMVAIEAILDYEALLLKPMSTVTEQEFKAVHKRMFTQAHHVMDMRLNNLQDALHEIGNSDDYKDFLRRN